MKSTEDKIDDFLLDRLSQADRQAFEEELEADQDLAKQVKLQQQIMGGLAVIGREQFKARLQRIKKETMSESPKQAGTHTGMARWIWWLVGLLVASLLTLLLWKRANTTADPNAIYADLFEVYEAPSVQRDLENQALIETLTTHYREGAYQVFIDSFALHRDKFSTYPELLLSLGISYLQMGQSTLAAEAFLKVEQGDYPAYHDHARWYRILAALQSEEINLVKELLPALLEDEAADHHLEAKALSRRL